MCTIRWCNQNVGTIRTLSRFMHVCLIIPRQSLTHFTQNPWGDLDITIPYGGIIRTNTSPNMLCTRQCLTPSESNTYISIPRALSWLNYLVNIIQSFTRFVVKKCLPEVDKINSDTSVEAECVPFDNHNVV